MRCGSRILALALCLVLGQLAAAGQKTEAQRFPEQGQVVARPEPATTTDGAESAAQGIETPVLGFVRIADLGELRSLVGIPGASAFGESLAVPSGTRNVYFAPGQRYALLAPGMGNSLGLLTFQGVDEGAVGAICGAISEPDIVAFSPGGSAAALYSKAEGRLQVIAGLPDSPRLTRVVPGSDLPDELRFLTIADDGVTLLAGTVQSAVYLFPQLGSPRLLYSAEDLEGMAFAPRTTDLVAFDRAAGTAFLLQDVDAASSYLLLAHDVTGLDGTVFLETSRAGAVIASTGSDTVWKISLQSPGVQSIRLPGMPQMLQPLRISGDYLLFYRFGSPAWILDSNGAEGSVEFVPAGAAPRRRPRPISLSTARSLKSNQNEQADSVVQSGFGAGCTGVTEPIPGPNPLPRPIN